MVIASICMYAAFAYDLERDDFIKLITLSLGLFFLFQKLIQLEKWNFKFLLLSGIGFRMVFLMAVPNLSQDFYRFIWDGELILLGINPYSFTPDQLLGQQVAIVPNALELQQGMGSLSAGHFSNYPPLNQLLFSFAALFSGLGLLGPIIAMRSMIIAADIGILYMGKKLLAHLNLPGHLIFWYFLNPLVILELTGNLHFEGAMLFFFCTALYFLAKGRWQWGAVFISGSILIKLVPLLFLPLFIKYHGLKKSMVFFSLVGLVILVFLLPFFSLESADHYLRTISLWFSNFEFNAGIYNLIKGLGNIFDLPGYRTIRIFGNWAPFIIILMVALFSFLGNNKKMSGVLVSMLWILSCYYFLATTVHPWYVVFLVLLCLYTPFRFPLVWSGTVLLSYWAYSNPLFIENSWILLLEYGIMYGFLIYELWHLNNKKLLFCKN
ncbi:MAG: mannosyltransferase [Sediminicola sp.]